MSSANFEFGDDYVLDAMCDNHVQAFNNFHIVDVCMNGKRCYLFDFTAGKNAEGDGCGTDGVCIFKLPRVDY